MALEEAERREREELERFFAEFDKPVSTPPPVPSNVIPFPSGNATAAAVQPAFETILEPAPEPDQLTIFEAVADPTPMAPLRLDEHLDYDYREEAVRPESEFDLPLKVAPVELRCWAGLIDAAIVLGSAITFCSVFYGMQHEIPKQKVILGFSLLVIACFWAIYQILFLTYAGTTPGLRAMRLGISGYDDQVPSVQRRLYRAVSLVLTTMSLGIGFAWAVFDEDRLGWHDRMTRTFPRQLA
ncbi:MAG: RDD family protein [Acidobacteriales bacterium]|nr:RDD family protein [Terriglobales bacterium]